ncbi:hypothetical protein ILP97_17195 [Amycolatopsis sp. H6(2020)]|nr:hypothetical protein [Amycolatopsis sp. H6(2020)]
MSTISDYPRADFAAAAAPLSPAERDAAWARLHAANQTAHGRGAAAGPQSSNSYPVGSDERYWWREGQHQRPFTPLTTEDILTRLAHDRVPHQSRRHAG